MSQPGWEGAEHYCDSNHGTPDPVPANLTRRELVRLLAIELRKAVGNGLLTMQEAVQCLKNSRDQPCYKRTPHYSN